MRGIGILVHSALTLSLLMGPAVAREKAATESSIGVPAMPNGILVQDLILETGGYGPRAVAKPAYASVDGKLHTYDNDKPGESTCYGDCLKDWKPFVPPTGFKPSGDWSVIKRTDGTAQVALTGKPLYISLLPPPAPPAPGMGGGRAAAKPVEEKKEEGPWRLAEFNPIKNIQRPAQIGISELFNVGGQVLVDANGLTLYTYDKDTKPGKSECYGVCTASWMPAEAGAIVRPVGDFTIMTRTDGLRQWAYKGKPLYRYSGDTLVNDTNGFEISPEWRVAKVVDYFMPTNVAIHHDARHDEILVTTEGLTLYGLDKHRYSVGQHNVRRSSYQRGSPTTAAAVQKEGAYVCEKEADCKEKWKPLAAAPDALPTMLWTIVDRADGQRQWAYMGYPLYTYADDKALGDTLGHDLYHITDPNNAVYWRVALP